MNAPHTLHQLSPAAAVNPILLEDEHEVSLLEYWHIILDSRWLIGSIVALALAVGSGYVTLAKPVYETNLIVQVEDSQTSAKSFLGEAASLFDVKTPATAEIEILHSRMVIGRAVDSTRYYIEAAPRYLPVVGSWLARTATSLSTPGFFGMGGWVKGNEKISVTIFEVPPSFEDSLFTVTSLGDGKFGLSHPLLEKQAIGSVGSPLEVTTGDGNIRLVIASLAGKPGAEFNLTRRSNDAAIESLQEKLKLSEKGRQSGVIEGTMQDTDRYRLMSILNEIGKQYVRQNVERKAAEAQKTLAFLDEQLPQFKKQLASSEDAYNKFRNQKGTVALDEETKLMLASSVDLQGKLVDAKQKRLELVARFTPQHPSVVTLDAQIGTWNRELQALDHRIKALPTVQQDALRLERDVKVNNELYEQLQNNVLQLQLVREGKIGNVRVIDTANLPREPVAPKKGATLAIALVLGLIGGLAAALLRNAFFQGIRSAHEIETNSGLNVYSTIPLSGAQDSIAKRVATKQPGVHILTQIAPQDAAVESLRSLRTALQFAMLEAPNNRVLITGATPGVGKSFVSANFAAVLASAGKRVLLIDADLRKGHLNQYFGVERREGLSELVAGSIDLATAIRKQVMPNLDFMPTGVLPPNPAELVVSGSFVSVLDKVSPLYDVVLIDSAPVLVAADTVSISSHVGPILLVARAAQTQIGELLESTRRLAHTGKSVNGVLFNAVDLTRRHYGSYGYRYGSYQYRDYNYAPTTERA